MDGNSRGTERAAFAKCMHFAKRCGQASVEDVCKEWGISKSHGYRILNRWRTEESVVSRPRSGRPRALTEEDMKTLECLSEERNGYFTWESLAALFTERQVRAHRVQLCILLAKQSAGAKCVSVMYLASTQKRWREDWSGQSSMLITLGRGRKTCDIRTC